MVELVTRKREEIFGDDVAWRLVFGGYGWQFDRVRFIVEIVLLMGPNGSANANVTVPFWVRFEFEGR